MKCNEIWWANLPTINETSCVQRGLRPVVIVSNNMANTYSPVVTVVPLTSNTTKTNLPTHVMIRGAGLKRDGLALCEQILTVDKSVLVDYAGFISNRDDQLSIRHALAVQLNLAA